MSAGGIGGVCPGYARTRRGAMHFIEAGAAEGGRGEPVLLLHATPRSARYYRRVLPLLAPHLRAIAVDTPGFGHSHPLPPGATIESMAECFVAFLDALGLSRAHLVGLHTGNKIAAALAAGWPDRVASVLLAGQTHSLIVDKGGRDAAIGHIVDHYFPKYGENPDGAHLVRHWAAANAELHQLWWPEALRNAASVSPAALEDAEAMALDYLDGWRSIVPAYEAIFGFDMEATLRRVQARARVLELLTPGEMHFGEQAPQLAALMSHGTAARLHGDGEIFETRPAECAEAIVAFVTASAPSPKG